MSLAALCHVYVTMDVYLSIKVHGGVLAQELLHIVAERMDVPQEELALVAVTFPGGIYQSLHTTLMKISPQQPPLSILHLTLRLQFVCKLFK